MYARVTIYMSTLPISMDIVLPVPYRVWWVSGWGKGVFCLSVCIMCRTFFTRIVVLDEYNHTSDIDIYICIFFLFFGILNKLNGAHKNYCLGGVSYRVI